MIRACTQFLKICHESNPIFKRGFEDGEGRGDVLYTNLFDLAVYYIIHLKALLHQLRINHFRKENFRTKVNLFPKSLSSFCDFEYLYSYG